jgi:DNA-binding GntR family transcriptional regulator
MTEAEIVAELHRAIADRRLPPGTKLASEQLAEIFVVSRARIRAVLQKLAHDKVVTLAPNRGAFVARPSPREAREVFAARKLIETALAGQVAAGIDAAGIARLRAQVAEEAAAEAGADRHRELKVSHDFHVLLAEIHGNGVLADHVAELAARSELITAIYERQSPDICNHEAHGQLVDLLAGGDGKRFAAAMAAHFDDLVARLVLDQASDERIDLRTALGRTGEAISPR